MKRLLADASVPATVAGLIVLLVGLTSSAVLVFQAASTFGLDSAEASSWLGSLCFGMGVLTIILSLRYRTPVLLAWSTPGAALLAAGVEGVSLPEACGAFLFSAALILIFGVTGLFERLMNKIPLSLASALLGGILLRFCLETFVSAKTHPTLIAVMVLSYLAGKKFWPRFAMLGVLVSGTLATLVTGEFHFHDIDVRLTQLHGVMPVFSWSVMLSLGVPLFIVTMASQNLPGIAVMRAHGYATPISPVIAASGGMNLLTAPFGGFALNLAAITAAIAMGPEAHEKPEKRYFAGVVSGVLYVLVGGAAGTVTSVFAAFPREMVLGIAGLALMGTTAGCLQSALAREEQREAAFLTFALAASGVSFFGIGAAFWAILAGGACQGLMSLRLK